MMCGMRCDAMGCDMWGMRAARELLENALFWDCTVLPALPSASVLLLCFALHYSALFSLSLSVLCSLKALARASRLGHTEMVRLLLNANALLEVSE